MCSIDAAINPGNSGGPCFDDEGVVVGIAFQGISSADVDNIGYIIPACLAKAFLHDVKTAGGFYPGVPDVPFRFSPLVSSLATPCLL